MKNIDKLPASAQLYAYRSDGSGQQFQRLYILKNGIGVFHDLNTDRMVEESIDTVLARGYWTYADDAPDRTP